MLKKLLILATLALVLIGCSSGNNPIEPNEQSDTSSPDITQSVDINDGGRMLWGYYQFTLDLENETFEAVPLRSAEMHLNAAFLVHNNQHDRFSFANFTADKDTNTIGIDVGMYHPFPGRNDLAGFDVRGIFITSGSQIGIHDPSVRFAGPTEPHIINADGLTRWWNQSEFPGVGVYNDILLSYQEQPFGFPGIAAGTYNCTLNAYKLYADDLGTNENPDQLSVADRAVYSPDTTNWRRYELWFPTKMVGSQLKWDFAGGNGTAIYNYAVDASWARPIGWTPGNYDVDIPTDYPTNANMEEAFLLDIDFENPVSNTLYYDPDTDTTGGFATFNIHVYDWRAILDGTDYDNEVDGIYFELPELMGSHVTQATFIAGAQVPGADYAVYQLTLDGTKFDYDAVTGMDVDNPPFCLLTVVSGKGGYQADKTGYNASSSLASYRFFQWNPETMGEQLDPVDPTAIFEVVDWVPEYEPGEIISLDASDSYFEQPATSLDLYEWDFDGDGTYGDPYFGGTQIMPHVKIDTPGDYIFNLKVTDNLGGWDTTEDDPVHVEIHIIEPENQSPIAVANVAQNTVEAGNPVSFDATMSFDPDGTIVDYEWDFDGDGIYGDTFDAGIEAAPIKVYDIPGIYDVTVKVTDDDAATDISEIVTVNITPQGNEPPVAIIIPLTNTTIEVGETVSFDGSTSFDPDGTIISWEWDFDGDGIYGDTYDGGVPQGPIVQYDTSGDFYVNLRVTDDGAPGLTDTAELPIHIIVNENQPPVAVASALTSTDIFEGETVQFDGSSSYAPSGTIDMYEWDFNGDGTYGDMISGGIDIAPEFTYNNPGTYYVDLKVTDSNGGMDTLDSTIEIVVHPTAPNQCPVPVMSAITALEIEEGGTVEFDGSASYDVDGWIVDYEWDFDGDGVYGDVYLVGSDQNPTAQFNTPGFYSVKLKVEDNDGCQMPASTPLVVQVNSHENELPVALCVALTDTNIYEGEHVTFDGTGSHDTDGTIVSYEWDFDGDGVYGDAYTGGTDTIPIAQFPTPGHYMVSLKVTDNDGGEGFSNTISSIDVFVSPTENLPPVADADVLGSDFWDDTPIEFDATDSYDTDGFIEYYLWDFDNDGVFGDPIDGGTAMNPLKYLAEGWHTITLRVIDNNSTVDDLDVPLNFYVDRHVEITLAEDQAFKSMDGAMYDSRWNLTPQNIEVDYYNPWGPWDFTTFAYNATNEVLVYDASDPVVAPFISYFPGTTQYFTRWDVEGAGIEGWMYFAEEADYPNNELWIHGHVEQNPSTNAWWPYTDPQNGPIAIHFPMTMEMDEYYQMVYQHIFNNFMEIIYHEVGLGEGMATVPYMGGWTTRTLQTRMLWEMKIDGNSIGQAIIYKWIAEDGTQIARLYAYNTPEETNFNELTYEITGTSYISALTDMW